MAFLEAAGVYKGYGQGGARHEVLRHVDLHIEKGEFVAIVGCSGAGKTTLVSMLAGLVAPDAGVITLDGHRVTGPGRDRGLVFQNYSLLPWLTVQGNVALAVDQAFAHWPAARRRDHVEKYVAMVGLTAARQQRPGQLSGGMRQRVALARAMAMEPDVLLMDEPLGALDALTRATLQEEIERLWRRDRRTVVMVTNDVDEGILLADRIVPLGAGPAATLGPAVTVGLERPRNRKALHRDPRFQAARGQVLECLLGAGGRGRRRAGPGAVLDPLVRPLEVGA
jgi:nitrate/nitrite transport system ATP-binding protein